MGENVTPGTGVAPPESPPPPGPGDLGGALPQSPIPGGPGGSVPTSPIPIGGPGGPVPASPIPGGSVPTSPIKPPKRAATSTPQSPMPAVQDTYEKMGPTPSKFLEPPPPPDIASFSSSRKGRTTREKKSALRIEGCVYVLYGAVGLYAFMAFWTFLLYAHSVEIMNMVPALKATLSFLVPSDLESLSDE